MPTYDLRCEECGDRFELFLTRILRDEDRCCPSCGSTAVKEGLGGGFLAPPARAEASAAPCVPRGGFG